MRKINPKSLIIITLLFFVLTTGCILTDVFNNYVQDRDRSVEKLVELTLTAIAEGMADTKTETPPEPATPTPQPSAAPTQTEQPETGMITGELYYPSEGIPPLRIVAFKVGNLDNYTSKEIHSGRTYQLEVPAGTYYVVAYLLDSGVTDPDFSGAYSQFVLCGLQADCDDHSLVPVEVLPGETVRGIDLADWYLPIEESDMWPSNPFTKGTGSIQGSLGYPSEYIPPMRVVAFDILSQDYFYVDTQRNQDSYELMGLPPSTYHVVAYVREQGPELAGGYSIFVICGMTQDCDDHSLVDVDVYAGEVTEDVNPVDFYMQPGEADWPENPTE